MTELNTYAQKQAAVKHALTKAQTAIMQALPKHMDPDRMFRVYLTACNTSPLILDCEPVSIVGAVMRAAAFGLSLESVTGESFIIPRRNKNLGGRYAANFQIGYKGLRKLALQGDRELRDLFAYAVYEHDVFDYQLGAAPEIRIHKPAPSGARGKLLHAYAVAVWKDHYRRFDVIDQDVIDRAKKFAGGLDKPDSPWNTNEEAMWRKTAMRRLCNQLPLSSDIARALARSDGIDGYELLRERASEDPRTRGLLVDLGANSLLEPKVALDGSTGLPALDRAAEEAERSVAQMGLRQRRRRRNNETDPSDIETADRDPAGPEQEPQHGLRDPGED
jgi:recombination protein RecT